MKTIEERAEEFCENNICVECNGREDCNGKYLGGCIHTGKILWWLIQFGKSERDKLTRWIDPKDFMPEANKNVLVKCSSGEIQTDFYAPELGGFFIEHSTHAKVTGWREMM